jgi:hypothetical protein
MPLASETSMAVMVARKRDGIHDETSEIRDVAL